MNSEIFHRYPELKEILGLFRNEIQKNQLPPERVILDDQDVMRMLKISKRRLQYMKSDGSIPYHTIGKRTYYLQSDLLALLNDNRHEAIKSKF